MRKELMLLLTAGLLTGCGRRELEDCSFPTVLTVTSAEWKEEQKVRQQQDSRYRSFAQVKAVVVSEQVAEKENLFTEVLGELEENPVFARNMLVFAGDAQVLEKLKQKEENMGIYLENMCRNQPKKEESICISFNELLNELHNNEPVIRIPKLGLEQEQPVIKGVLEWEPEAVETLSAPVPRKIKEDQDEKR